MKLENTVLKHHVKQQNKSLGKRWKTRYGTRPVQIEALETRQLLAAAVAPVAVAPNTFGYFDASYYMQRYSDVASAVRAGTYSSAYSQYVSVGAAQGRSPSLFLDPAYYLQKNPDLAQFFTVSTVLNHYFAYGQREGRIASPYFNPTYYLTTYPDLAAAQRSGMISSPFAHFISYGIWEGRNPFAQIDNNWYLAHNPDVAAAKAQGIMASGVQHYLFWGWNDGRSPSAIFDEQYYRATNPDVDAAIKAGGFRNGLDHYLRTNSTARRTIPLYAEAFDEAYYLRTYPDIKAAVDAGVIPSALYHYANFGRYEGRNPNAFFSEAYYLAHNGDLTNYVGRGKVFASGYEHFLLYGYNEGRQGNPYLEKSYYEQTNPDVVAAVAAGTYMNSFVQFARFGSHAGKSGSRLFDEAAYRQQNADVVAGINAGTWVSGLDQYLSVGQAEGRVRPTVASGNTLNVKPGGGVGYYATIQAALSAANNGDTIMVSPGTYTEHLFITKYVSLVSSAGAGTTILDGGNNGTIIRWSAVPTVNGMQARLSGFTLTRGKGLIDGQGGALTFDTGADVLVENNIINGNVSVSSGGAIQITNSSPTIRNNTINNNTAFLHGGAFFIATNAHPLIENNTISYNVANSASPNPNSPPAGGAMYIAGGAAPLIRNNTLEYNSAYHSGGAISLREGVTATLTGNTIRYNTAPFGGGVHIETEGAAVTLTDNTITNNTATVGQWGGSGFGGGISVWNASRPLIEHNVIANNNAVGGGAAIVFAEGANAQFLRNLVYGNVASDTVGGFGGAIHVADATVNIENNYIYNNTGAKGGGIALMTTSVATVQNNTIVSNHSNYSGGTAERGGGLLILGSANSATVRNNIIALNDDYQVFEAVSPGQTNPAVFSYNLIDNSGRGMYFSYKTAGVSSVVTFDASANINASNTITGNPLFVDAAGSNYHLQASSQAINAGTSTGAPTKDYDGDSRPANGLYDIGADEYVP